MNKHKASGSLWWVLTVPQLWRWEVRSQGVRLCSLEALEHLLPWLSKVSGTAGRSLVSTYFWWHNSRLLTSVCVFFWRPAIDGESTLMHSGLMLILFPNKVIFWLSACINFVGHTNQPSSMGFLGKLDCMLQQGQWPSLITLIAWFSNMKFHIMPTKWVNKWTTI